MPKSVNKVILVGNVGKDPEVRYTPSGIPVGKFSLATNERFKDKNGNSTSAPNGTPSSPGSGLLKSLASSYPSARKSMSKGSFKPQAGTIGRAAKRSTGQKLWRGTWCSSDRGRAGTAPNRLRPTMQRKPNLSKLGLARSRTKMSLSDVDAGLCRSSKSCPFLVPESPPVITEGESP